MKVLFYGIGGWIGGLIAKQWTSLYPEDTIIAGVERVDPRNQDGVRREIDEHSPDRVICTLGRTSGPSIDTPNKYISNIDYLEQPGKLSENLNDNLFAPVFLAMECHTRGIHMVYMGTGCIFSRDTTVLDGSNGRAYEYTEADAPDFTGSQYSCVKGTTDQLMGNYNNVLNLRIRMPIVDSWHPKNFVTKIIGFKQICSMPNSMTYLPDLIPVLIQLSREKKTGTLNFVNPGVISHQRVLELYKQYINPEHEYELIDQSQLSNILSAKRSNNRLSTALLCEYCTVDKGRLRTIEECIEGWFKSASSTKNTA